MDLGCDSEPHPTTESVVPWQESEEYDHNQIPIEGLWFVRWTSSYFLKLFSCLVFIVLLVSNKKQRKKWKDRHLRHTPKIMEHEICQAGMYTACTHTPTLPYSMRAQNARTCTISPAPYKHTISHVRTEKRIEIYRDSTILLNLLLGDPKNLTNHCGW